MINLQHRWVTGSLCGADYAGLDPHVTTSRASCLRISLPEEKEMEAIYLIWYERIF